MSLTEAQPLSKILLGTGTFIYRDGASATTDLFQWDARRVLAKLQGTEGPDEIDWDAAAFFAWEKERVEHFEWVKAPEYGWPTKPDARERQRAKGHVHGFLATIIHFWRGLSEPTFSVQALSLLSGMAEEVGRERFEENARLFEGEVGAWYAAHVIRQAEGGPVVGRPEDPVHAAEFDARLVRYARRMRELDREEKQQREGEANDVVEKYLREQKASRESADLGDQYEAAWNADEGEGPSESSGGETADQADGGGRFEGIVPAPGLIVGDPEDLVDAEAEPADEAEE